MVTEQEKKPVLDEQTFERLLEAAHVLQEHNRGMRELEERVESRSAKLREQESANQAPLDRSKAKSEEASRANSDYTLTLAEIVEAQRQIQTRHLELDKAMAVVAERVARITGASGAAIAILEGSTVRYRAGAGAPALPLGTEVPLEKAVCAASLRTGQVIRSEDVNLEFLFDPETCRPREIVSLTVVPIYREDEIIGALELYFDKAHGFAEQDIHTCQLMAGLVTEAIGRDAEVTLKKSMAAERSSMLAAIERLQPNLVAWAEGQTQASTGPSTGVSAAAAAKTACWKCGNKLLAEEQFCGKCGAPRANDAGPSSMQSKLAAALQLQQSDPEASATALPSSGSPGKAWPGKELTSPVVANKLGDEAEIEENAGHNLPEPFSLPELEESDSLSTSTRSLAASASEDAKAESPARESQMVWTSAAKARDFLESLAATDASTAIARFWRSRRGDFYLAVAVILVAVVIRWGIWSNHSVGATGRGTAVSGSANRGRQPSPEADLSAFDKFLISLGLAEAPEAPENKGNPDTPVWVDLHTALYYCPGSDLYGKTSQGKLASQRDAQLDQFEPADRRACD
jgi:putative methionine-R-sulfoxide reductase with GAF domain